MKLQNCNSLDGRVIPTKMSKCFLSLKVLQSNIKVPLAYCYFYMCLHHKKSYITLSLVHLIYTADYPRLSNNHSGFLCHVTFLFYSNYTIGDIYPSFNAFYLRKSAVLKWKTLLPHINFPKTALVRCSV